MAEHADDHYPDDHEWLDVPPMPNCRCIHIGLPEFWLEELEETLDEKIGDTMPLIDVWIFPGLIIEY